MAASGTTSIQDLPVEVLNHIFQLLPAEDLDACFNVSHSWKSILNSNRIWKRCCIYPEEYFKSKSDLSSELASSINITSQELCKWRHYYERQQRICENWSKGQYTVENRLSLGVDTNYSHFFDGHGNYWLFESFTDLICISNITSAHVLHCTMQEPHYIEIMPLTDKILVFRTNYVKIFNFSHPAYEVRLQCRFLFENDDILPVDEVVPDNYYMSGVRYTLVGYVFIGYSNVVTNIHETFLHIWDINSSKKIGTESVFQQSYVDFVNSVTGCDITTDFMGGLLLFPSDTNRFLVNLIDDRFELCQISLYSLDEMSFVGVIAQLESRTAWCWMEGDVVVVYHIIQREFGRMSVFNVHGQCLTYVNFTSSYNPALSKEFWFGGSKLILKFNRKMHVVTIINAQEANHSEFEVVEEKFILTFVVPKFLLLYDKRKKGSTFGVSNFYENLSVWNVESGQELWKLENIAIISDSFGKKFVHPGKLIVRFPCNKYLSILNFE